MRLVARRALRGPNYFADCKAIYAEVRLDSDGSLSPGIVAGLKQLLPEAPDLPPGATAADAIMAATLGLQRRAAMDVSVGLVQRLDDGNYAVVVEYHTEHVGLQAMLDGVAFVDALIGDKPADLGPVVQRLREIREEYLFGPSTQSIVDEAMSRGVPIMRLNQGSHVQLGHGWLQEHIQATMTGRTSGLGVEIADDKERTKQILKDAGVAVPRGESIRTLAGAKEVAESVGYPVVVKPLVGNHGKGITTNIRTEAELETAFAAAKERYPRVLVEQFLEGADHRVLVIDGRMIAAARRDPAHVVGDGKHTIAELLEVTNADPRRGFGHEKVLTRIIVDHQTQRMLEQQELALDDVPAAGRHVWLKSTANLSTGGTATDVTDEIHPAVKFMVERMAAIVGLDIMGVDIVAPHLRQPLPEIRGGVVEVNAAPGFRMHLEPTVGTPRNVAAPVVDMLFPEGGDGRIPLVAVTGTNGKTTTIRLISHILKYAGGRVGMACTGAVEVENHVILEGDYSGPTAAQTVLREPGVTHAVLEVARGGILRRGLGFDRCDVGILLNVASDHLGQGNINTLDDLARLKGTVLRAVAPHGIAILNADDALVAANYDRLSCRKILFSMEHETPLLAEHLAADPENVVVTVRDQTVVLRRGTSEFQIAHVQDIPITLQGAATFNVQNAMAAVAAGYALDVTEEDVRAGLVTFNPTVGQLPGRMNLSEVDGVKFLIDYGHNVPALLALAQVLPRLARGRRINVANAAGNRRDEDLNLFGQTLAGMYDHIILCDPDPRRRKRGETPKVIQQGLAAAGFAEASLQVMLEEADAIDAAIELAKPGDLVVLQADDVAAAVARIRALREEREGEPMILRVPTD